jgi:hypothetical protein
MQGSQLQPKLALHYLEHQAAAPSMLSGTKTYPTVFDDPGHIAKVEEEGKPEQ